MYIMAKDRKNTKNKALHSKLLNRKNTKLQEEKKDITFEAFSDKMNQQKNKE
jgi:hypothetical protein